MVEVVEVVVGGVDRLFCCGRGKNRGIANRRQMLVVVLLRAQKTRNAKATHTHRLPLGPPAGRLQNMKNEKKLELLGLVH